jgi:CubicO group peptidase (beta-lactamase class C family)
MKGGISRDFKLKTFAGNLSDRRWSTEELLDEMSGYELDNPPGEKYSYSNLGYGLLAAVVERISGKSLGQNLEEQIFQPFGMRSKLLNGKEGVLGLADSFILIPQFILFGSRVLIPSLRSNAYLARGPSSIAASVDDMYDWDRGLKGFTEKYPDWSAKYFSGGSDHYKYGWETVDVQNSSGTFVRVLQHDGEDAGYMSSFYRVPETDSMAIFLWNTNGRHNAHPDEAALWRKLKSLLADLPAMPVDKYLPKIYRSNASLT